jgi:hypothetical protein
MTSRREAPRKIRLYLQDCSGWLRQEEAYSADPAHDDFVFETQEERTARRARLEGAKATSDC